MNTRQATDATWTDVWVSGDEQPTVSYRSAMNVYEESLVGGSLVGRGWNAAGHVSFYDGRLDPAGHPTPQAFWLELDGQALTHDWQWGGVETTRDETGSHTIVELTHAVRPVTVEVHTRLDGTAIFTRWLAVTNTGGAPAALSAVASWSGVLQQVSRWRSHLGDSGQALYSLGYFGNTHWGNEGDFGWHDLPLAGYRVDGRYRRDRHRHPWFVLRNNATGEHFVAQFAWSGGYSFEFDLDADAGTTDLARPSRLPYRPRCPPAPQRVIAPRRDSDHTPKSTWEPVFGDLDTAVQAMHDHLRQSAFLPQPRGRGRVGRVRHRPGDRDHRRRGRPCHRGRRQLRGRSLLRRCQLVRQAPRQLVEHRRGLECRPGSASPEGLTPFPRTGPAEGNALGAVDGRGAHRGGEARSPPNTPTGWRPPTTGSGTSAASST